MSLCFVPPKGMFNVLYPHFCQFLPYQRWICRSFLDKLRLRKDMAADVETLRPEYQGTITLIRSLATILSKALVFFSSSLLTTKMSFHWPATSFRSRKISTLFRLSVLAVALCVDLASAAKSLCPVSWKPFSPEMGRPSSSLSSTFSPPSSITPKIHLS